MFDRIFKGTNTRLLVAVGTALVACAPLASQAADESEVKSVHVTVSDLNLNTDEGVHGLYRRVETAAYAVCDVERSDVQVRLRSGGPCVRETIAHTVRDLGNARLSRVYIEKNGPLAAKQFDISDERLTAKN